MGSRGADRVVGMGLGNPCGSLGERGSSVALIVCSFLLLNCLYCYWEPS